MFFLAEKKKNKEPSPVRQDVIGIILFAVALFSLIANFSSSTGLVGFYIIKMFLRALIGVGVYVGSTIAGYVYGHYGEKAVLALRYLAEKTPWGQGLRWDGALHRRKPGTT